MTSNPENEKRQLTPAEQLMQRLESPLSKTSQASEINNDAVRLFIEGKLTPDQLTKVSIGLAKAADELAAVIYVRDMSNNKMPETKLMAYSSMQSLAQENRNRAVTLTLERQRNLPPQIPRK